MFLHHDNEALDGLKALEAQSESFSEGYLEEDWFDFDEEESILEADEELSTIPHHCDSQNNPENDGLSRNEKTSSKMVIPREIAKRYLAANNIILHKELHQVYKVEKDSHVMKVISDDQLELEISRDYMNDEEKTRSTSRIRGEFPDFVKIDCEITDELEGKGLYINCLSGIYDAITLQKEEFDFRKHRFFFQVKAELDKGMTAETPAFDDFLEHYSGGDESMKLLMLELIGYLCLSRNVAKSFFVLGTAPDTGKSILMRFMEKIIFGEGRVTGAKLEQMGDNFGLQSLARGSELNLQTELPADPLKKTSVARIKELTGGDYCNIAVKNSEDVRIKPRCKWVFGTNNPIRLTKPDRAFFNRLVIIPMLYPVSEEDKNLNLLDDLISEADGIIYKATRTIPDLLRRNFSFTMPEASQRMMAEWMEASNTIKLPEPEDLVRKFLAEEFTLFVDTDEGKVASTGEEYKAAAVRYGCFSTKELHDGLQVFLGNAEICISQKQLTSVIKKCPELGIVSHRTNYSGYGNVQGFAGLRMKHRYEENNGVNANENGE